MLDARATSSSRGAGLRLGHAVVVEPRHAQRARCTRTTFADVAPGELLLYEDAYRTLALAVNRGSAAELLGLAPRRRAAPARRA